MLFSCQALKTNGDLGVEYCSAVSCVIC